MSSNSIRGLSIPDPETIRAARAAEAKRVLRRKLDDLPSEASAWANALTIECSEEEFVSLLEAFTFILNASRANGSTSVSITRGDLGDALGMPSAPAQALLDRLTSLGMAERRIRMVGQPDCYRPLSPSTEPVQVMERVKRAAAAAPRPLPISDKRLMAGLLGVRPS